MKIIFLILLSFFLIRDIPAQVNINIYSFYEDWRIIGNRDFSELSNMLSVNYKPLPNTFFMVNSKYASVGGDINDLSGFSDIQFLARYNYDKINLSFNGGVNIPSGKTRLGLNEFLTSQVIGTEIFNLKTPGFGQGLNFFLGAAWLKQLSDNFVVGFGASYQLKGNYQPLAINNLDYSPSDEISATAGFDIKLNESSTLTGDITGIFYGTDKVNNVEIFSSGSRVITNIVYKKYFGFDYLTLTGLYRNIALDEFRGIFSLIDNEKINPDQFYFNFSYSQRFSSKVNLLYSLFTSIYENTASFYSGYKIFGIGVNPEFLLSRSFKIPVFLKYSFGIKSSQADIKNFELGMGLIFSF